jgi:hypothetical protein
MKNLFEFAEALLENFGVEEMIAVICNLSDEKINKIMEG